MPSNDNKPKMAYSRDLPKMAVWHYGLKLQWYLTGYRYWRYSMVWYGLVWFWFDFVGIVWYWGGGTIMDFHGLSWRGVMTGMDDWDGWLAWMTGKDDWHGWLAWMTGMDDSLDDCHWCYHDWKYFILPFTYLKFRLLSKLFRTRWRCLEQSSKRSCWMCL